MHRFLTLASTSVIGIGLAIAVSVQCLQSADAQEAASVNLTESAVGEALFFDTDLSLNRTQSCATCHDPAAAFTDPRESSYGQTVSIGDDGVSAGTRNTPTLTYAALTPPFVAAGTRSSGGHFWDGRASDLATQAGFPLVNPVEMGLPDQATAVDRVMENPELVEAFRLLYGVDIFDDEGAAFKAIGRALAAFQSSSLFSPFDSRYDRWLRGEYEMTAEEELGRELFFSSRTNCSACHLLGSDESREPFTNYRYFNIGTPSNPALADLLAAPDLGLAQNPMIDDPSTAGFYRNTGLRNVAVTGPYMHNGVFSELRTVLVFYNHFTTDNPSRLINPETGEPFTNPEVPETVTSAMRTARELTEEEIDALAAYLKTLTDRRFEGLLSQGN